LFEERNSDSVARLPGKKNESGNQSNHDKHPVLEIDAQKSKMLDEKVHLSRPVFGHDKRFGRKNILFLYFGAPVKSAAAIGTGDAAINLAS
jgi:hypothetical protein